MPTITISLTEREWELLHQRARQERITPEQAAQKAIQKGLRVRHRGSKSELPAVELPRVIASLPRGDIRRVLATLEELQQHFPLGEPAPSREAIDAYLKAERDSWDNPAER